MTQATKQPATTTRRAGGSQPTVTGHGPREHDLRTTRELVSDPDQDNGNERHDRTERNERDAHGQQSEPRARHEQDARRESGRVQHTLAQVTDRGTDSLEAATPNSADAFAAAPDMSKVLTAWFDMVGHMLKQQQQFFATMLRAGNTNTRTITNDRTTTKV